jgi:predicted GNAT family acetyltransferase/glutaredoxin
MLTLYQAEWCPFSSAVREVLTELGVDFVALQVEPWPEDRSALRAATGKDQIPTLVTEDGSVHIGTRRIFEYLETLDPWPYAADHRRRFEDHRPAREADAVAKLLARFRRDRPGGALEASPEETQVVNVRPEGRYELRLGDRVIGHAADRRQDDVIGFTHTEVDKACEGRGFGTRLVAGAVEDARKAGLEIVPLCSFVRAYLTRTA